MRAIASICAAVLALLPSESRASKLFHKEPNALGFADHYGKLSAWWELGEIQLSENQSLPIRINFHSAQDKVANSMLGWNWWFPLMESTVMKKEERHVIVRTIGGSNLHLWKTNTDPTLFRSANHQWLGRVDRQGNFTVRDEEGKISMLYSKGKLQSLALPTGETLTWKYNTSGRPTDILNKQGISVFHLDYDERDFPKGGEYTGENGTKEKISMYVGNPSEIGLSIPAPALVKIGSPKNNVEQFRYLKVEDDKFELEEVIGDRVVNKFKWKLADSCLLAVNEEKYSLEPMRGERAKLKKVSSDGAVSSYWYDSIAATSYAVENNEEVVRKYIMTTGSNFGKRRSVEVFNVNDRKIIGRTNAFYDEKGRLISELRRDGNTYRNFHLSDGQILDNFKDTIPEEAQVFKFFDKNGSLILVRTTKGDRTFGK